MACERLDAHQSNRQIQNIRAILPILGFARGSASFLEILCLLAVEAPIIFIVESDPEFRVEIFENW